MANLRRLDLNLLVTLDVLLSEHNVTRAAERLNFSQPSVSVHLAKLRDVFDDPLLLPGPRGMRPTARAEALREPLREALEALELAVAPASPFNPAVATHTWRVAATDYAESTIILPALAGLRAAAPGTRLAVVEAAPPPASPGKRNRARSIWDSTLAKAHPRACAGVYCLPSGMCWRAALVIHG